MGWKQQARAKGGVWWGHSAFPPSPFSFSFPGLTPVQCLAARDGSVHPWHLKLLPKGSRRLQWEEESVVGKHREPSGPKHRWHRSSLALQPPLRARPELPQPHRAPRQCKTSAELCWGSWQPAVFLSLFSRSSILFFFSFFFFF